MKYTEEVLKSSLIGSVIKCGTSEENVSYWKIIDAHNVPEESQVDDDTIELDIEFLADSDRIISDTKITLYKRRYQKETGRSWESPRMDVIEINDYDTFCLQTEEPEVSQPRYKLTLKPRRLLTQRFKKILEETCSNEPWFTTLISIDEKLLHALISKERNIELFTQESDALYRLKTVWDKNIDDSLYFVDAYSWMEGISRKEAIDELKQCVRVERL